MSFSSLVYYVVEHLITISFGVFIAKNVAWIRKYAILYTVLECFDLVDFLITGNTMWFEVWSWPITYNVLKVFAFILVIIYNHVPNFIKFDHVKS